jgi:hypothetical protein
MYGARKSAHQLNENDSMQGHLVGKMDKLEAEIGRLTSGVDKLTSERKLSPQTAIKAPGTSNGFHRNPGLMNV